VQFGGLNGELGAQCVTSPSATACRAQGAPGRGKGILTDINTEELAHWEVIATMIFKLTWGATISQI
jgi:spore coat protein JC